MGCFSNTGGVFLATELAATTIYHHIIFKFQLDGEFTIGL
jgi:hypothetical protein